MKNKGISLVGLVVVIFLTSLASASFNFTTNSLNTNYASGDIVSGVFTLSLQNQTNLTFTSPWAIGNISLTGLLNSAGYGIGQYSCTPNNCTNNLNAYNGEDAKNISVTDSKQLYAFAVGGSQVTINDFSLSLSSNVGPSCFNQLNIDLFNDNSADIYNTNYVDELCGPRKYGCFDSSSVIQDVTITQTSYCQKVTLYDGPAYRIGAKITKHATTGPLVMELYDPSVQSDPVAQCILPTLTDTTQEVDCIAKYSSKSEFDAYICIRSPAAGTDYTIRSEADNPCGRQGTNFSLGFQRDYEIYGQSLKYGSISGTLNANTYKDLTGQNLTQKLQQYISGNYNSKCSPSCVIPFVVSGHPQQLTLGDLSLRYSDRGASGIQSNSIYDVSRTEYLYSSNPLTFSFEDLGIKTPNITSTTIRRFELYFGNTLLVSRLMNLTAGIGFDINPVSVPVGQPVLYSIRGLTDLISSTWNFGDGSSPVSSTNFGAVHLFSSPGSYNVVVGIRTISGQVSTRTFTIYVSGDTNSFQSLLSKKFSNLNNLTVQINSLPLWLKPVILHEIDLITLNASLNRIKAEYNLSGSDSERSSILSSLQTLQIPSSIEPSQSETLPLVSGYNNINVDYLAQITGGQVNDSDILKGQIAYWNDKYYDSQVDRETLAFVNENSHNPVATKFSISLTKKQTTDEVPAAYLIIGYPKADITFSQDYGQGDIGDSGAATKIPVSNSMTIEFSVPGSVSIQDLGAYLSPEISAFSDIGNNLPPSPPKKFPWLFLIIALIILVILFFVVYIVLQEWYKKNYENHLFKKKDDLFNIINFIYNSRASGLKDSEIKSKLSKNGWSGEQISYAFKKIDGKRTGMWEIPLFKSRENKEVREELMRRHPGQALDTRFVRQRGGPAGEGVGIK